MCHVLLILPLIALPLFWVLPPGIAMPAYGVVLGLSALIYGYAMRAMRQPRQNGAEGMIGQTGRIVVGHFGESHVLIRSELWEAVSAFPLQQGERVTVVAAENTKLRVLTLDALSREREVAPGEAEAALGAILIDNHRGEYS